MNLCAAKYILCCFFFLLVAVHKKKMFKNRREMVFWAEISTFGAYANELSHQPMRNHRAPERTPTARNVQFVAQLLCCAERTDGSSIVVAASLWPVDSKSFPRSFGNKVGEFGII